MIPDDPGPGPGADGGPFVIGIDPGTRVTGYGALVLGRRGPELHSCGVLRPPARDGVPARLAWIQGRLEALLDRLGHGTLAVESAYAARNVRSALRIGEVRGMVLATAARRGFEVVEIAPAAAKKAVLGHGSGSKEQVALMVAAILGVPPLEVALDATDALAVALAHLSRRRLEALARGRRT